MRFYEHTSDDLVRWAAKGVADETGLDVRVAKGKVLVDGRVVMEGSNDVLFGYLNDLADGFDTAKTAKNKRSRT